MSRETLGIYLNDHLTGSVFAVETLERLLSGNHPALPKEALQGLLSEIEADRDVLRGLLEKAEVEEHLVKKAAAWLSEKLGRMKLDEGPLGRMEMLETLALGISGKLQALGGAGACRAEVPGAGRRGLSRAPGAGPGAARSGGGSSDQGGAAGPLAEDGGRR